MKPFFGDGDLFIATTGYTCEAGYAKLPCQTRRPLVSGVLVEAGVNLPGARAIRMRLRRG